MSVNIKLEKVVSDNLDFELANSNHISSDEFNNLNSQNENLKLLVSLTKQQCDEQTSNVVKFSSQIDEMKNSIASLENELMLLRRSYDESSNIISEKNKLLNIVYSTINDLELNENLSVTNSKTAVLKLNKYRTVTKELQNQVTDNKIILMTLCRILGCSNTKIIQSLKDIISENEAIKQKFKVYEQFYQRSLTSMNQMSSDLHLNGYEKINSFGRGDANNVCTFHSESFDNWNTKMANLRAKCLNNTEQIITKSSSCTSKTGEFNQLYANKQISVQQDSYLPNNNNNNNFYQTLPPPLPVFPPYHSYPPLPPLPLPLPLLPLPLPPSSQVIGPFPRYPIFRNDLRCVTRPFHFTKSNKSNNRNNKVLTSNKQLTNSDLSSNQNENSDKSNLTKNFEINSNVFDWQNCSSQQAKEELLKLEKKMFEDSSTITSSSNGTRCLSPSISLVEDRLEIWDYDSDSDSVEVKRCKWGA